MTLIFLLCDRCSESFATDQIWPHCDTCQLAADSTQLRHAYQTARDVGAW